MCPNLNIFNKLLKIITIVGAEMDAFLTPKITFDSIGRRTFDEFH